MARTYLPTLIFLARRVHRYCIRNGPKLRQNMSEEVEALFDILVEALDALIAAVEIPIGD